MRSRGNLPWDSKLTSKGAPCGACRLVDLQQEGVYTSGAERRETCSRSCKRRVRRFEKRLGSQTGRA